MPTELSAKHEAGDSTPGSRTSGPPVLDVHPTAFRPDALPGYTWLQLPDRMREVHRQCLEFWYDPPGCALTDEELDLLRRIAAAEAPVMFQAEGSTVPAHLAFDHLVDVLRDLRKAGWIVLEVWVAGTRQPRACSPALLSGPGVLYGVGARGARADRRLERVVWLGRQQNLNAGARCRRPGYACLSGTRRASRRCRVTFG